MYTSYKGLGAESTDADFDRTQVDIEGGLLLRLWYWGGRYGTSNQIPDTFPLTINERQHRD